MSTAYTPQNKDAQKLLDMLAACAMNQKKHSVEEMAAQLGITLGLFRQLQIGMRPMHAVSDELLASMAKYLGVPFDDVLVLAGKHQPASKLPGQAK
jgi:transcriptional regulator with XRE-family HTH domain